MQKIVSIFPTRADACVDGFGDLFRRYDTKELGIVRKPDIHQAVEVR